MMGQYFALLSASIFCLVLQSPNRFSSFSMIFMTQFQNTELDRAEKVTTPNFAPRLIDNSDNTLLLLLFVKKRLISFYYTVPIFMGLFI
jgi:hypothetical protein